MAQAILFDTHALIKKLKDSGFEEKQAEALTDAFKDSQEAGMKDLATKGDLKDMEHVLKGDIREIKYEVNLLKWMVGFVLAGILSLVLKTFFIF